MRNTVYTVMERDIQALLREGNKSNANMAHNPETIHKYVADNIMEQALYNYLPEEYVKAHTRGDLHIHDREYFLDRSMNCLVHDPRYFIKYGLRVDGNGDHTSISGPPMHYSTMINHVGEMLLAGQSEMSGGQGVALLNCFLAPFVEDMPYSEIKQGIQSLVYNLNMAYASRGGQVPFTTVMLEFGIPEFLKDYPAYGPGGEPNGVYGDWYNEANMIQGAFCEVLLEGDYHGKMHLFPNTIWSLRPEYDIDEHELDKEKDTSSSGSGDVSTVKSDPNEGSYATLNSGDNTTDATSGYDITLTFSKLQNALNRLYGEIFDLLFVADTFDNIEGSQYKDEDGQEQTAKKIDAYNECEKFLSSEFQMQRPSQLIAPLTTKAPTINSSVSYNQSKTLTVAEVENYCNIFKDSVFNYGGLFGQRIYINGASEPLSIIESAAYMCGYISSLNVGNSLTFRTIPGVTGVEEEIFVGPKDDGYKLTNIGMPVIVNKVRNTKEYCVLNSKTPSGYDLGQIRAVSYLIKQYNLQQYLGLPNDANTRAQIAADMEITNQEVMSEVTNISSIDTSNIFIPTKSDGTPLPKELYIELDVVVYGVLILIDLGVNMSEEGGYD